MTQKELIEFCKENDPNYNKDASFKVMEPMWSIPKGIGGIGITESEFKNGFYVEIDTKGRKGFEHLEGRVFYFRNSNPSNATGNMYNSHWKKYFVPLNDIGGWSREIVKEMLTSTPTKKFKDLDWENVKPQAEGGIALRIHVFGTLDPLTTEHLKIKEMFENPIEEFPIVKESVETVFRLNHTWLKFKKRTPEEKMTFTIFDGDEPFLFQVTKESFSDLVDLMNEARKDLLK